MKPHIEKKKKKMGRKRALKKSKKGFPDFISKILTGGTRYSPRREHFKIVQQEKKR
jgi:hypothetical protein